MFVSKRLIPAKAEDVMYAQKLDFLCHSKGREIVLFTSKLYKNLINQENNYTYKYIIR